jgi:hypothetical protein
MALLLLANWSASSADELDICYNWGCAAQARVSLSEAHFGALERLFAEAF